MIFNPDVIKEYLHKRGMIRYKKHVLKILV